VDVDVHRGESVARLARRLALVERGDVPGLLHAEIVHADTGSLRELPPQQRPERFDPRFDRLDAYPHRVTGGDAEADLAGDAALPVFEPARVATDDVGVGLDPGGGLEIDEGWFEHSDRFTPHVQKTGAAGPAQILAARGRAYVAADPPHIDRELVVQRTRAVQV
jgi:hypothetical protein